MGEEKKVKEDIGGTMDEGDVENAVVEVHMEHRPL